MKYLIMAFLLLPTLSYALTPVTSTGVSGSGFPVALTTAGETYQLTENISCATTCFTAKASNITIDLNGFTASFGTANNPGLTNTEMEQWTDVNTLTGWTILSGSVTQRPAYVWGSYDAELSATASIKSSVVTLNAGQTYVYYAMIRGNSADSYTISVRSAVDDSVLASSVISGDLLNRAFSMGNGVIGAVENEYKPVSNESVYLQIDGAGTSIKRLHVADIKPAKHYFFTSNNYRNTALYPDLPDNLFSTVVSGTTIKNGTITQGAGYGVKSAAVYSAGVSLVQNVTINMSGNNTASLANLTGTVTIDAVTIDTASILNFNRMHPTPSIDVIPAATGAIEIKNSTILNDPIQSIRVLYTFMLETNTHTTSIHDNIIRGKEQVTEGYAIVLGGGNNNVTIYNNDINPYKGRGILVDSVANRSGYLDSSRNVTIRNNTIRNIYERRTPEYDETGLEAAGIRVRDWGGTDPPEGHRNLKIHDNTISVYADSLGTHRSYGINFTSQSANTSAEIYNNNITAALNSSGGADWEATCMAFQGADMSGGGSILVHNNTCNGSTGVRLGGNDGGSVKNVALYANDITTTKNSVFYAGGYQNFFSSNLLYCNKFTNTVVTEYNIFFEDTTTRTMAGEFWSNNLFTNANSSGYEVRLVNNYSSSLTSCGNGTLDIVGGGAFTTTTEPCNNGSIGCYETAGVSAGDTSPPSTTVTPTPGTYSSTQSVTLACNDNVGCTSTLYCLGAACTPTTPYTGAISIPSTNTLRYYSTDAASNVESTKSATYTINAGGGDTTPPTTTASPAAGTYTSTQSVTLAANETATIYFTTNGDTPTVGGPTTTVYSSPISISSTKTIKYFARDTAGNDEVVKSASYTIQAPLVPITAPQRRCK